MSPIDGLMMTEIQHKMGYRFNDWLILPHFRIAQVVGFHGSSLYPKTHLQVFSVLKEDTLDLAVRADLLAFDNKQCLDSKLEMIRDGDGSYWSDEQFCPLGPVEAFEKSKGLNFYRRAQRTPEQLRSIELHTPGAIAYSAAIQGREESANYQTSSGTSTIREESRSRYHCDGCGYSGLESTSCARCGKRTSNSYAFD